MGNTDQPIFREKSAQFSTIRKCNKCTFTQKNVKNEKRKNNKFHFIIQSLRKMHEVTKKIKFKQGQKSVPLQSVGRWCRFFFPNRPNRLSQAAGKFEGTKNGKSIVNIEYYKKVITPGGNH